jgi:hypothetical protein
MTFGPALSLGVSSLGEVVDVKIDADLDPAAILGDLSAGAQPRLRFVGGASLGANDPGITRVVNVARYTVGLPRDVAAALGGEGGIAERVARAFEAKELVVMRRIDGVGKRVDVREFMRVVAIDADALRGLAGAGIHGDLVGLSVEVEVRGSGGVKIAEVVEAIFGDAQLPHRAARLLLGRRLDDGSLAGPLDLAALRPPRSSAGLPGVTIGNAAV